MLLGNYHNLKQIIAPAQLESSLAAIWLGLGLLLKGRWIMSKCIRCGDESWHKCVCPACMDKWHKRRISAFDQAVAEIGPLGPETHRRIVARVRQLEKIAKDAEL